MTIQEISDLRKAQGNWHMTSFPLYTVQRKKRTYGMDSSYSDHYEWMFDGETVEDDELIRRLDENEDKFCGDEELRGYSKVYYRDDWEFVTLFFTEKSAREYVATKGYRHGELRLYVDSAHNNWELKAVIGMLEGKK